MTTNPILLSNRVGVHLGKAVADWELLKKSLEDEKSNWELLKKSLEDEKAMIQNKVSQLESDKSELEAKVVQLEKDKSQLESDKIQSKAEIEGLNDKMKELEAFNSKQKDEKVTEFEWESNGKMAKTITARGLSIAWSGTPKYWTWKFVPDSKYEVAELLKVWSFEIFCMIHTTNLTPNTTYGTYFVFKLTSNLHGFNDNPVDVYFDMQNGEIESITRNVMLVGQGEGYHPTQRQDGWMEVELGNYDVRECDDGHLDVFMRQDNYSQMKGGLVVKGIELRPK